MKSTDKGMKEKEGPGGVWGERQQDLGRFQTWEREEGAVSGAHVPGGWWSYTAAFIQVQQRL